MYPRRRRTALLASAAALLTALTAGALMAAPAAQAASGCQVAYSVTSQWPGGFSANIAITNLGSAVNGWTLNWTFTAGQAVTQAWGFTANPASGAVTARNVDYTAAIPTNGTVSVGFNGSWNNSANPVPASFTLNGTVCTGSVTSPAPSATRSTAPSPSRSVTPSPSSNPGTVPTWPTKSGDAGLPNGTIQVSGVFDGGMKRYCCIGDGGQSESQDPMFELANGATIKNVILGSPAGDGIHCLGTCTIQNVWWEDVGEDAATFLQTNGGTSYIIGGGAKSASDKVFQHNGNGTVNISGFYVENAGKLYRACGNCTNSYQRNVVIDNVWVKTTSVVAGINTNWGDTARFTRINVYSTSTIICDKYKGAPKGSEPTHIGSGADGVNCFYNPTDIIQR
ncbi:hypothetical protein Cs7R123_16880 [Catellatospora sp. TT07R-123]|uniref:pectate lyase n=1 Tax=Catellatospora sp. TT07R-123 TaxID=2733863 RepID=UPI001B2E1212|nr:pectate lyase [Catellatospora sp. TT07R-123]GHJ44346.1 hypothetical protein Cs7R123_16880 [Catellatospora sp. TT07R-123]